MTKLEWLKDHITYNGENCLIWPFAKIGKGYGQFRTNNKNYKAHRIMCELVHGPPPIGKYDATHSCNNGTLGCVDPRHLNWELQSEHRSYSARIKHKPYISKRYSLIKNFKIFLDR